jgi:hypothetical protein
VQPSRLSDIRVSREIERIVASFDKDRRECSTATATGHSPDKPANGRHAR